MPFGHVVCGFAVTTQCRAAVQHKVARLPVGKIDRREKAWTRNPGLRFLAPAWAADDGAFHDVSASFDANVVCHPSSSAKLSNHLGHRTSEV
jgi:hypothetical protein